MTTINYKIANTIKEQIVNTIEIEKVISVSSYEYKIDKIKDVYGLTVKLPDYDIVYSGDEFLVDFEGTFELSISTESGSSLIKKFGIKTLRTKVQFDSQSNEIIVKSIGHKQVSIQY